MSGTDPGPTRLAERERRAQENVYSTPERLQPGYRDTSALQRVRGVVTTQPTNSPPGVSSVTYTNRETSRRQFDVQRTTGEHQIVTQSNRPAIEPNSNVTTRARPTIQRETSNGRIATAQLGVSDRTQRWIEAERDQSRSHIQPDGEEAYHLQTNAPKPPVPKRKPTVPKSKPVQSHGERNDLASFPDQARGVRNQYQPDNGRRPQVLQKTVEVRLRNTKENSSPTVRRPPLVRESDRNQNGATGAGIQTGGPVVQSNVRCEHEGTASNEAGVSNTRPDESPSQRHSTESTRVRHSNKTDNQRAYILNANERQTRRPKKSPEISIQINGLALGIGRDEEACDVSNSRRQTNTTLLQSPMRHLQGSRSLDETEGERPVEENAAETIEVRHDKAKLLRSRSNPETKVSSLEELCMLSDSTEELRLRHQSKRPISDGNVDTNRNDNIHLHAGINSQVDSLNNNNNTNLNIISRGRRERSRSLPPQENKVIQRPASSHRRGIKAHEPLPLRYFAYLGKRFQIRERLPSAHNVFTARTVILTSTSVVSPDATNNFFLQLEEQDDAEDDDVKRPDVCDDLVDCCTCMCCVKGLLYHCTKDGENEGTIAENPCSCVGPGMDCCFRWSVLGIVSVFMPCLYCYLPVQRCRNCVKSARRANNEDTTENTNIDEELNHPGHG